MNEHHLRELEAEESRLTAEITALEARRDEVRAELTPNLHVHPLFRDTLNNLAGLTIRSEIEVIASDMEGECVEMRRAL